MAQTLTEYLKIDSATLTAQGTFDPILKIDSKFFIDPKSLERAQTPEFRDAYAKIRQRSKEVLGLLARSSRKHDLLWQKAYEHFPKGEVAGLCIGYGFDNINGRGMGPKLVTETMESLKEFLDTGIDDPALFEIVGVFQYGVGCDLISDFIARTLLEEIWTYTDRISRGIISDKKPRVYRFNGKTLMAFANPERKSKAVLLIPKELLQPLPVAADWSEIDIVCQANREARKKFTELVGFSNWKAALKHNKRMIKPAMLANPEVTKDLLAIYGSKPPKPAYDYAADPEAQYAWQRVAKTYTEANPVKLERVGDDPEKVVAVVRTIVEQYKRLIEDNGLWSNLYTDKHIPMHERHSQHLFYGVADSYCTANDLDISPETHSGHGPIDFKLSHGRKAKVAVEIKLTKNPQLAHGLNVQLPEYEKSEQPYKSFFLVIKVTHNLNYQKSLSKAIAEKISAAIPMPEVCYIDATVKDSASKLEVARNTEHQRISS